MGRRTSDRYNNGIHLHAIAFNILYILYALYFLWSENTIEVGIVINTKTSFFSILKRAGSFIAHPLACFEVGGKWHDWLHSRQNSSPTDVLLKYGGLREPEFYPVHVNYMLISHEIM